MKANTLGLIVGGVLPALFLGLSSVFQKTSNRAGIAAGPFLRSRSGRAPRRPDPDSPPADLTINWTAPPMRPRSAALGNGDQPASRPRSAATTPSSASSSCFTT